MSKAIARPQLAVVNGHATTTSLQISENFGKLHKNVILAVEKLECSPEFRRLNFKLTSYEVAQPNGGTRKLPAYTITRDGFVFLAMGFTGKEAAQWKEAYITAFNAMEAELAKPAAKPALLPAATHLNRDAMHHINKRAWQLAQVAYEDFRERMQRDVMVKGGHTKPEDWQPEETRREVLQAIEVAAHLMEAHAKVLRNRGKRLAGMVEEDYGQAVRKFTKEND